MQRSGLFISLEGVDGCGKSTQTGLLADWLRKHTGAQVIATREPGGTEMGKTLRQLIQHGEDMDPRTEALLYAADRAHHVSTKIRPALNSGGIVLTDRYLDSSVAYQAAGRQLPADQIEQLSLWATDGLLPDVTVLLDLDPKEAAARQVGELDRIEKAGLAFQERVRAGYLERAKQEPGRWFVVSGNGAETQVFEAIKAVLEPVIKAWEQKPTQNLGEVSSAVSAGGVEAMMLNSAPVRAAV